MISEPKPILAVYSRVSTDHQSTAGQEQELQQWCKMYANEYDLKWYSETFSGRSMKRPEWAKLETGIDDGTIQAVLVWRLDRLGRTASGLTKLFEKLNAFEVRLICLSPAIDLSTSGGRLIANIIASVAQYEREIMRERTKMGQSYARSKGKKWGGRNKGQLNQTTRGKVRKIIEMRDAGKSWKMITDATGLSLTTCDRIIKQVKKGIVKM